MTGQDTCHSLRAARRLALIAVTIADGHAWLESQPHPPSNVVMVTVRSPSAARGLEAGSILATPAVQRHPHYERLLAESLPAVMAQS